MKKKICLLLLAFCVLLPFVAFADASDCNHNFVYQYRQNESVHFKCTKCLAECDKSIVRLMKACSNSVVNATIDDDTQCLDFVDDDIINAKDYAMIRNEYKTFKRTPDIDIGGGF